MGFRVRELQRGELDGFLSCFQAAFGVDESSVSVIRNSLVNDPYFHPERVRVGVLDGVLVSHAVVLHRAAYVGNQVITVAGVTAVGTSPAHRGKGFGARAMQDAVRLIRQRGYDLAMLTTRIPRFFERFGFREVPQCMGYQCPAAGLARVEVSDTYTVEKVDYNRHWPALAAIYHQYSLGRTGLQVRDMRYWETWPRRGTFPHGFTYELDATGLIALANGQMVAYLAAYCPPDLPHLTIAELAHLSGHDQAALLLVRDAARSFLQKGAGRAIIHIGGDAPLLPLLEAQKVPFEPEAGPGLMILIPNRGWLRAAGFANADDAVEHLFRSTPPIRWHRDGY
jgi:GNAT superfamily N-acetyltransferase